MSGITYVSKRTGNLVVVVPVVTGFTDPKMDMFRVVRADGSFTSVDRDSVRRNYSVV